MPTARRASRLVSGSAVLRPGELDSQALADLSIPFSELVACHFADARWHARVAIAEDLRSQDGIRWPRAFPANAEFEEEYADSCSAKSEAG